MLRPLLFVVVAIVAGAFGALGVLWLADEPDASVESTAEPPSGTLQAQASSLPEQATRAALSLAGDHYRSAQSASVDSSGLWRLFRGLPCYNSISAASFCSIERGVGEFYELLCGNCRTDAPPGDAKTGA